MKLRTPPHIFVPLTILAIILAFAMILPNDADKAQGGWGMLVNLYNSILNVLSSGLFWAVLAISVVMLFIINNINRMVESHKFNKLSEEEKQIYLEKKKTGYLKNLWKSRSERQTDEEEQSIILDHGFDGIKELDNSLPQWWLSLFYFGCAFMVVYVLAYSFTEFAHPLVEYEEENAYLEEQAQIWIADNDITIDGAINKYKDEAAIARGKEIFTNVCATCHTANGGGAAGPNLTDDYWINQVQDSLFYNIYDIVYNGSPNNAAMQAFGQTKQITGIDIEAVASYVYDLNMDDSKNVTPAEGGLEPQGTVAKWYGNTEVVAPEESADEVEEGSEEESTEETEQEEATETENPELASRG